jgi:hypothetical protein
VTASLARLSLAACLVGALGGGALAQPAAACDGAEHRGFDFWLGDWQVTTPDGKVAGINRIERAAGGCALIERWQGAGGYVGTSLNWYDRGERRWHQVWVDGNGETLLLAGVRSGDGMVLASTPAPGDPTRQRITWTPLPDGAVRQHWEASDDGGASWRTVFDGRYLRR